MTDRSSAAPAWRAVRDHLRARGQRWTNQRRTLVEVLVASRGHVTGAELVERCRERDPSIVPSTIYRSLDVLEDVGFVRHAHGLDGREEFEVLPAAEHGHLHCGACGASWELSADDAAMLREGLLRTRGFRLDLSHLSVGGRCASCLAAGREPPGPVSPDTETARAIEDTVSETPGSAGTGTGRSTS